MRRRAFAIASAHGGLMLSLAATIGSSRAQRPAHPIAGPPRPGGVFGPGRFPAAAADGVNRTLPPGLFVVRGVNARENIVQLADADGRTARVVVEPTVFDVSELQVGDEVLVDFVVPAKAGEPLRAAGLWTKE